MAILCIGAEGFIGKRVVDRLQRAGENPVSADLEAGPEHADMFIDVRDTSTFPDSESFHTVVNLAAEHKDNVKPISLYYDVNVQGARNVCWFASNIDAKRIIFTSSVAVYGPTNGPTDENGEISYNSHYGKSKYEAEGVYRSWQAEAPLLRSLIIIRPAVVFGEGNRGNVYNLLRAINKKFFVMIGKGENVKSMAYVENLASFIHHVASFPAGTYIFNYADSPAFTMQDLVSRARWAMFRSSARCFVVPKSIAKAAGSFLDVLGWMTGIEFPVSRVRVEKFTTDSHFISVADSGGFSPPVPIAEALTRTIEHEFR